MRALTGLSPEQLEALIAHELGHIKRFDVAVNFVQVVAETLFFFHPAVWWLNKRIRADREDCCDDIAVAAGGSSVGYAKALATIATWRDVPSFAMAATGSPVATRVARLLGMNRDALAHRRRVHRHAGAGGRAGRRRRLAGLRGTREGAVERARTPESPEPRVTAEPGRPGRPGSDARAGRATRAASEARAPASSRQRPRSPRPAPN